MTDVVTALGHRHESSVATVLERAPGVRIVRRCADVAELVSVTGAGLGDAAVVSSDLRGLDLAVVTGLVRGGLVVVGLHPPDDEDAERRLHQLGVPTVLPTDADAVRFAAALDPTAPAGPPDGLEAIGRTAGLGTAPPDRPVTATTSDAGEPGWRPRSREAPRESTASADEDDDDRTTRHSRPGSPEQPSHHDPDDLGDPDDDLSGDDAGPGRPGRAEIVAVWGPTGSPGRTTVATTLASELAARGVDTLLVDADTYGGCVAQGLGLLDEAPGVAAACRAADQGSLDVPLLARLAPTVGPRLRVLTGLPRAERWPEVRAAALERVLELSRSIATVVVVDCGFCLEDDEELSYDTAAPRRNEATLTSLASADAVVAVGGADPVALQRLVRGLQQLGTVPSPTPVVVVNRVRATAVGSHPRARIAESLERFAGLDSVHFVPDEPAVVDGAVLAGRSVVEHAPDSAVRTAMADLADALAPWSRTRSTRRRRRFALTRRPST
jgi:MinD-like ATPase involved in chromosome partitioning or flagellar assembly